MTKSLAFFKEQLKTSLDLCDSTNVTVKPCMMGKVLDFSQIGLRLVIFYYKGEDTLGDQRLATNYYCLKLKYL